MKNLIKSTLLAIATAAVLGFASNASALMLTPDITDTHYLGSVSPDTPAGTADELAYINKLAIMTAPSTDTTTFVGNTLVRSGNTFTPTLPQASALEKPAFTVDTATSTSTLALQPNSLYLLVRYGNAPGADRSIAYVWYVAGLSEVTVAGSGLSHFSVATDGTRVPDGGATAMLLGMGLTALAFVNRKR